MKSTPIYLLDIPEHVLEGNHNVQITIFLIGSIPTDKITLKIMLRKIGFQQYFLYCTILFDQLVSIKCIKMMQTF